MFIPRSYFRPALAIVALLALTGLTACQNKIVPPCPIVRVDNATASLTKFKDGPGRETSDVEYRADITGFKGECDYGKDKVEVTFNIDFAVTGGAAAKGGTAPLYYFVAIPQFFPDTSGKRVVQVEAKLPARSAQRQTFSESDVHVTIPFKKDETGASFDVYVGFQVDAAQLEFNRTHASP